MAGRLSRWLLLLGDLGLAVHLVIHLPNHGRFSSDKDFNPTASDEGIFSSLFLLAFLPFCICT